LKYLRLQWLACVIFFVSIFNSNWV
jgi:hypothetical protein